MGRTIYLNKGDLQSFCVFCWFVWVFFFNGFWSHNIYYDSFKISSGYKSEGGISQL